MALAWQVTVCFIVISIVVSCFGHNHRQRQIFEHSVRVSKFKCLHPQPRVVYLEDLMPLDQIPKAKVIPASTVLHKCENAGCCGHIHRCAATAFKEVKLVFGIFGTNNYLEVAAMNHTKCGCQDSVNRPK